MMTLFLRAFIHLPSQTCIRAPEEKDFNELLKRFKSVIVRDHIVFNCQMGTFPSLLLQAQLSLFPAYARASLPGRGRTTTGMVVACMMAVHRYPELLPSPG